MQTRRNSETSTCSQRFHRETKKKEVTNCCCCVLQLNYAGWIEFHENDELFCGVELTTLCLVHYVCEFCKSEYFLEM